MTQASPRRLGGLAGICYAIMVFFGGILARAGSEQEPEINARAFQIARYFGTRYQPESTIGNYWVAMAFFFFVWFLGALWVLLPRGTERDTWLAAVAVAGGAAAAILHLIGQLFWTVAAYITTQTEEGIHIELARMFFGLGHLLWATSWLLYAVLLIAVSLSARGTRALPVMYCWFGVFVAALFLLARAMWPSDLGELAFFLFLLWVIVVGFFLFRTPELTEAGTREG